jgi:hypothetical protein
MTLVFLLFSFLALGSYLLSTSLVKEKDPERKELDQAALQREK